MKRLLFFCYILFLLGFTVFSYAFVDPNLSYFNKVFTGFASQYRLQITFVYITIVLLFFIFYFLLLLLLQKKVFNNAHLKLLIGITVVLLFFSYPAMLSFDIFNYIATAKVLFFYHENPYIIMPIEFAGDPLLSFTHAANKIALYGPSWILITAIPYFTGIGNFLVTLFTFKLFISMFYLGTVFLIWKMSKNLVSVSLFALNPLVIVETLVGGHNDIVMIFFALFSFYVLMKKKSIILSIIFFTLPVFVKYSTIFLFPIYIYIFWKTIRKRTINWTKIFYYSSFLMLAALLLSPIREEIYPWYAIWFLPFVSIASQKRTLLYVSLALSFGLLLRYIPFMLLGTHFGVAPLLKTLLTFIPVFLVLIYIFFKDKLWSKIFSH